MKEIVNELIKNGYEAYVVGGYVRDFLLGINSTDIDICTNASVEEVSKIFKDKGKVFKDFMSFHMEENGYTYNITTKKFNFKITHNKMPFEKKQHSML